MKPYDVISSQSAGSSGSAGGPGLPPAVSEDYSDIIFRYQLAPESLLTELSQYAPQIVDTQYSVLHAPLADRLADVEEIGYSGVPKLFTYADTVSLEDAGILSAQLQPYLSLTGNGILIGFLDSGIDYTHPAFRSADGSTRILRIWDQTLQTGPAPEGMQYGTEFTGEQINEALFSADPLAAVPVRDERGHGTATAGIACGSADETGGFTGAAPGSQILFVRLKPAKRYLRDYFLIPEDADAFQETDLMLGVRYMVDISRKLRMPLVICLTLGTSQGGHTGSTPLEDVLTSAQFNTGVYVVTGTGNEVGQGHHFQRRIASSGEDAGVELLVDGETRGFALEFWSDTPDLYSIGFTSPLGETIQPVQPRSRVTYSFDFLLENSKIDLTYFIVEMLSGSQLAFMRFEDPTPGLWRIRVSSLTLAGGAFHLWLPVTGLVSPGVRFYSPAADTTLVIPSCAEALIATGTYDAYTGSMFRSSGRGYTRSGLIKPDFAAPGADLTAPAPGGRYTRLSGSCAAASLAAGAAALLAESGLRQEPPRYYTPREIRSLFQRGAERRDAYSYPNREQGYGILNLYGIFESFLRI